MLWDLNLGRLVKSVRAHSESVNAVEFSGDGSKVFSGSQDGTIRISRASDLELLATFYHDPRGDTLAITSEGFLDVPPQSAAALISISRDFQAVSPEQMFQSLYNPDLVREKLAGDPTGEVVASAKYINLSQVVASGPAPVAAIVTPAPGSSSSQDLIELEARLTDNGKGIGRIALRVNGITAAVLNGLEGAGPDYTVKRQVALEAGDNFIEVVAYNASNLLASLPARTTVTYTGPADTARPRLHVLAIGIDDYTDPGVEGFPGFGPLHLAVKDAEALATKLKHAATGHYIGEPNVVVLPNAKATREGIAAEIARMEYDIHPRDTFILFAAGHGISRDGRFYLIPHGYIGGAHRKMLERGAIGQDELQDWLANRIKAKRALVLLDTCESGALVSGHMRSRSDAAASEAGLGRLHEATGRPILTAAAMDQSAIEGIIENGQGHGIFTWALLDALRHGDTDQDGNIALSELVAHVQNLVPKIAAEKLRAASAEGQKRDATIELRGAGVDLKRDRTGVQSARFGSRGENFVVARRVQ